MKIADEVISEILERTKAEDLIYQVAVSAFYDMVCIGEHRPVRR